MQGKIEALCVSARKGEAKAGVASADFVAGHGLRGDAHAGDWHRQVSLLASEEIEAFRCRGMPALAHGAFGENLVVSGLQAGRIGLGTRIRLGSHVLLEVTQIGKVCHSRCAIYERTGDCIMPRAGLFLRVIEGGIACVGDVVIGEAVVPRTTFQAVVVTVSDRCSRGEAEDTAGPGVADALRRAGMHVYTTKVIPDGRDEVSACLRHYADGHSIDLIVAVGGTGFADRDRTPEAVRDIVERPTPGLDEAMRAASLAKTPHAVLSRSYSGIRGATLIVSVPGSRRGALENLGVILPAMPHALGKLRGDPSDCGR